MKILSENFVPYEKKYNKKYMLLNKPSQFLDRVAYDSKISEQRKKKIKDTTSIKFRFKPKINKNNNAKSVVSELIKHKYVTYY